MRKVKKDDEIYSLWMGRSATRHTIKIKSSPNKIVWYSGKIGREFEAELVIRGSRKIYYIDYLHFVPAEHCDLLEVKPAKKYIPRYA